MRRLLFFFARSLCLAQRSFGRLVVRARGCLLFRMGFADAHAISWGFARQGWRYTFLSLESISFHDTSRISHKNLCFMAFRFAQRVSCTRVWKGRRATTGSLARLLTEYLKPSRTTQPASAGQLKPTNISKLLMFRRIV